MSRSKLPVLVEYQGTFIPLDDKGWINATAIAERYGKNLDNWLRLKGTQDYIEALAAQNEAENSDLNPSHVRDLKPTNSWNLKGLIKTREVA